MDRDARRPGAGRRRCATSRRRATKASSASSNDALGNDRLAARISAPAPACGIAAARSSRGALRMKSGTQRSSSIIWWPCGSRAPSRRPPRRACRPASPPARRATSGAAQAKSAPARRKAKHAPSRPAGVRPEQRARRRAAGRGPREQDRGRPWRVRLRAKHGRGACGLPARRGHGFTGETTSAPPRPSPCPYPCPYPCPLPPRPCPRPCLCPCPLLLPLPPDPDPTKDAARWLNSTATP